MANALRRQFGSDYRVVESDDPNAALNELEHLRSAGAEAALIMANQHLASDTGTDFLAKTREAYPTARRLVLADFGDNWVMPAVARASTLGEVDHFDYLPVSESDERFLAAVGDILADWTAENARGEGQVTIVGERGDPEFRLLGEVLQRWQTYPIAMLVAGTPQADQFLAEHDIDGPLPVVAMFDGRALTGATVAKVSDMVGAGADTSSTFDLAVVGLGPAGFSAAVNAASEGLRVIMINDTFSQASSSPMIRNYLGFPAGVTGAELMRRAWTQAMMFGAVAQIGRRATGIRQRGGRNVVQLDDGTEVIADVVVLAIGVDYRRNRRAERRSPDRARRVLRLQRRRRTCRCRRRCRRCRWRQLGRASRHTRGTPRPVCSPGRSRQHSREQRLGVPARTGGRAAKCDRAPEL